jgi:hypothetical protein
VFVVSKTAMVFHKPVIQRISKEWTDTGNFFKGLERKKLIDIGLVFFSD